MSATMGLQNWWSKGHKIDKKTDEAVSRVVEAREGVTDAGNRLARALDLIDGGRMEVTLGRLVNARQVTKR